MNTKAELSRLLLSMKTAFFRLFPLGLAIFLSVSLCGAPTEIAFSQSLALEQIQNRITKQDDILQVEFRSLFVDSFTGDYSELQGRAWIGLNRYKVETAERILLVEDSVSSLWDPAQQRLVISDYVAEEDDFAPAKLFGVGKSDVTITEISGRDPLPGHGTLSEFGYTREELTRLKLDFVTAAQPRNSTSVRMKSEDSYAALPELVLVLDSRQDPLFIRAVDQVNNVIHMQFTTVKWVRSCVTEPCGPQDGSAEYFSIEVPVTAEVVDLRKN